MERSRTSGRIRTNEADQDQRQNQTSRRWLEQSDQGSSCKTGPAISWPSDGEQRMREEWVKKGWNEVFSVRVRANRLKAGNGKKKKKKKEHEG